MSGGQVQLVATGAQDAWLTGNPQVSLFRSVYRKYTHYANTVERQVIQGTPSAGGISTIRLEKKGDLVNYMYFTARDTTGAQVNNLDWSTVIDKIELLIGGQVIDTQDFEFMTDVEPVVGAQTFSQRYLNNATAGRYTPTNQSTSFLPLKFFFCKDYSSSIPLVALQYHDVELRITWSSALGSAAKSGGTSIAGGVLNSGLQFLAWANFIYLDQSERKFFAENAHDMLITQVQRVPISGSAMQELALAHPVKYIAWPSANYGAAYGTDGSGTNVKDYQLKVQINGSDIGEFRHLPAFTDIAQYYTTPFGYQHANQSANVAVISYALDTSKLQPTGTLNFSRIDTYRLVVPVTLTNGLKALTNSAVSNPFLYAVNYNVLRIQNGVGAVLYAN
jgi:hypothetical protein